MMSRRSLAFLGIAVLMVVPDLLAQAQSAAEGSQNVEAQLRAEAAAGEVAREEEVVTAILASRERAAGRSFSPALRATLGGKLRLAPTAALEAFWAAGGLGDIDGLAREYDPQVLGDAAADLVFSPVTPCRIINTIVAGGPIAANTTRNFFVNGSTAGSFETQGGTAGGCAIPDNATAVAMNFVAVGPSGPGDFRAFPFNPTPSVPLASVINYANVTGLNIANGIAQPVCNAATTTCTFDLTVQADVSAAHLVVDVVGFYRAVNKGQFRSFVVSNRAGPFANIPATGCTNAGGMSVSLTAPVAGRVLVRGTAMLSVDHTTGGTTEVNSFIGTTATECQANWGYAAAVIFPTQLPTFANFFYDEHPFRVIDVAAGAHTFFLNIQQFSGPATQQIAHAAIEATFMPN